MAKSLNDILKVAHDRIKGVHASTTSDLSTGKDPGVDYAPRAQGGQDFIAKHSVQKWDEPEGNPNYTDKVKDAPHPKQSKSVYESKKAEDTKCNKTPGQTWCPLHEMADCSKSTTIKEKDEGKPGLNFKKIANKAAKEYGSKEAGNRVAGAIRAKILAKEESIKEAYDDNSTKVSDWSDKKLKWHASDDRKHSSSHVPAWSELRRRAKTSAPAPKKTNEEVEQIDELSPATLQSYKSKAAGSEKALTDKSSSLSVPAKDRNAAAVKANQRRQGMNLATKKIGEEVEQVDEVSSALLHRAFQKAKKNAGWLMPGDGGKGDKAWNRVKKFRDAGVAKEKQEKAVKEEVIDEKMDDTQKAAVRAAQNWRQKTGTAKPSISDTKRTIGFIKKNSVAKEEVERVDEISKDLAKNYIKKATQDVDNTPEDDENATKKLNNRESGIRTASMKKNSSKYVKVPATEETDPGFKEGHVPDHQPKLAPKDASTMSKVAAMMAKERESFRQRQAGNTAKLVAANKSGKDS
ncbi:hypothetical protein UFOVP132_61 [uncultured Caudovirales phage]|uniref:Uncharacterized protein n=1 Tax=uncultured Caudovirales phage TaxID=2100421 RepID=A0A6J5LEJ1_9CAUD|nr:hypothetical protein UFOVP132_61 [uncultured Caudovirales phage]